VTPQLLATYRARIGLSQSEMAERWSMSLRTYQEIEQGRKRSDDPLLIGLLSDLLTSHPPLER